MAGLYEESRPDGIAISMPGIIDAENGYVVMSSALRYNDDFYLWHALYERFCLHKNTEEELLMNTLVFDIGGARTRYAVFDGEGTILTRSIYISAPQKTGKKAMKN